MTTKNCTKGSKTKEKILAGASRLFERKGVHGTSVEDIARELSIAKGTLYQYFASKEDLVLHTILWSEALLIEKLLKLKDKGQSDLESVMIEVADTFVAHFNAHGDFIRVYFSVSDDVTEGYRVNGNPFTRIVETLEPILRARCTFFSRELQNGELGILAFMAVESFRMKRREDNVDKEALKKLIQRRMRFFAHGVLDA